MKERDREEKRTYEATKNLGSAGGKRSESRHAMKPGLYSNVTVKKPVWRPVFPELADRLG